MEPLPTSSVPPTQGDSPIPSPVLPTSESPGGMSETDHRRPWMPKMEFPCFDGIDVHVWLDKCSAYFHLYGIPSDFRVIAAALHMVDKAAHWFQSYKQSRGSYAWENFVIAMSREFELNTHHIKTMQLLSLRQTGSVSD
jgi:hypothetical protein